MKYSESLSLVTDTSIQHYFRYTSFTLVHSAYYKVYSTIHVELAVHCGYPFQQPAHYSTQISHQHFVWLKGDV
jgi:hypothetical protein